MSVRDVRPPPHSGSNMPISQWLHYADHPLAPICRSRTGSNTPVGDNLNRARTAIERAQATLAGSGQRYLVTRADSTAATGLRQALGIYRNLCHRTGIQSHAARYAFARERMQAYRNEGLSEREARAATSLDLGHGDGRGRYISSVYTRE